MPTFQINKGIGKPVEFMGLKSQYLMLFAGGLLAVIIVFMMLYISGVPQSICIGFGLVAAPVLVWQSFSLNQKYGTHGLMKRQAVGSYPRRIINRKSIWKLFGNPQNHSL